MRRKPSNYENTDNVAKYTVVRTFKLSPKMNDQLEEFCKNIKRPVSVIIRLFIQEGLGSRRNH